MKLSQIIVKIVEILEKVFKVSGFILLRQYGFDVTS